MAITYLGGDAVNGGTDASSMTLTLPTHQADDFAVVIAHADESGVVPVFSITTPSGWTELRNDNPTSGRDRVEYIFYRRLTSSSETNPQVDIDTAQEHSCSLTLWRGIHTTDPFDATEQITSGANTDNPTCSAITPDNDDACILLYHAATQSDNSAHGAPTNYTAATAANTNAAGDRDEWISVAYRILTGGGASAETPGAWTHTTDGGNQGDYTCYTIALRAAPAAGDITRAPGKGNADFTGAVPALQKEFFIGVPAGSLSVSGQEPTQQTAFKIAVPVGALSISGLAPTVERSWVALPDVGALTATGLSPPLIWEDNHIRAPPVGGVALAGLQPSPVIDSSISVPVGALTATGLQPTVERSWVVSPPTGLLSASGLQATVGRSWVALPDSGTLAAQGYAPGLVFNFDVALPSGSLSLAGLQPDLVEVAGDVTRSPGAGNATFAGSAPELLFNFDVAIPKGSGAFAGSVPTLLQDLTVSPGAGALTVSGSAPNLGGDQIIPVPVGSLSLAGKNVSFEIFIPTTEGSLQFQGYAPVLFGIPDAIQVPAGLLGATGYAPQAITTAPITVEVPKGSLTATGQAPSRKTGLFLDGYAPTLIQTFSIDVPKGTLSLSGQIPVVDSGNDKTIPVPVGSLTVSGSIPSIERSWTVTPSNATLSASGLIPTLDESDFLVISPDAGAITALGYAPTLSGPTIVDCPVGSLSIGGHAPTCINTGDVRKGGRSSRKRRKSRRLFVEVDNQLFEVSSQQEALELLQRAREVVEEQADSLKTAPVIRVVTRAGTPSKSKVVKEAVKTTQRVVNRAFDRARAESSKRAKVDREIALLMALKLKQEEDEEEALIALLLS